jgi:NB-ARC domain
VAALGQVAAIAGLGGIGKTQTAVEYAYRHFPADYDWVFWVKADTELNAVTDLANIGRSLDLPGETLDELALQTRQWLETNDRWLLVFDNADRPELLKSVLPRGHQGKVLLTSRARRFASLGIKAPIEVQKLSQEESILFLKDRTQRFDLDAAELAAVTELARELDGLPLALEQAAAYIDQMQVPFAVYGAHYRRQRLALLERQLPETGNYPASVATTWKLNFEEVERRSPLAVQILQVSSVWAADDILEALLPRPELGLVGVENELTLAEGLAALASFSLIDRERETASYSMHRMVQEVVWYGLSAAQKQDWLQLAITLFYSYAVFFNPKEIENWQIYSALAPHVQAITLRLETAPVETLELAILLNQIGYYLCTQGHYSEAEPLFVFL